MRPLLFSSLLLLACPGVQLPREKLTDQPGALLFNGYAKTQVDCFSCHNGSARGSMRGPGLMDAIGDQSDAQLTETIKEGDGRMHAYKDQLSDEEINQILEWLRLQPRL